MCARHFPKYSSYTNDEYILSLDNSLIEGKTYYNLQEHANNINLTIDGRKWIKNRSTGGEIKKTNTGVLFQSGNNSYSIVENPSGNPQARYEEVVNPVYTQNPRDNGWYEYTNNEYKKTENTRPIEGKTYYRKKSWCEYDLNTQHFFDTQKTTVQTGDVFYEKIDPLKGDISVINFLGGKYSIDGTEKNYSIGFFVRTGIVNFNNCIIYVENENNPSLDIPINKHVVQVQSIYLTFCGKVNINNCNITAYYSGNGGGADSGNNSFINGIYTTPKTKLTIQNSVVVADSTKYAGETCRRTDGIYNTGTMEIKDCIVRGINGAIFNTGALSVDGGIYESPEHGGIDYHGIKEAYIKNIISQECAWEGNARRVERNGPVFYMGPAGVGGKEWPSVYIDNCTFYGRAGNQYIAYKWINKSKLHLSNVTIPEGRRIRIDQWKNPPSIYEPPVPGDMNIIYVGEECNVNAGNVQIRTSYGRHKAFTDLVKVSGSNITDDNWNNKKYYDRIEQYSEYDKVKNPGNGNPTQHEWYEYDNGEYVLSVDTNVQSGKTYYIRAGEYVRAREELGLAFYTLGIPYDRGVIDSLPIAPTFPNYAVKVVSNGTYTSGSSSWSTSEGDVFISDGNIWHLSSKGTRYLKGTVGNGNILPTASSDNVNHFYKVVENGVGPNSDSRIGDYYFNDNNSWILVKGSRIINETVGNGGTISDLPQSPNLYFHCEVVSDGEYHAGEKSWWAEKGDVFVFFPVEMINNEWVGQWFFIEKYKINYKLEKEKDDLKTYYLPEYQDNDVDQFTNSEEAVNEHLVFLNTDFSYVRKLDEEQGAENVNKVMQVGYDGLVTPGVRFNPTAKSGNSANQPVVIDDEGKLWTIPGGGSGGSIVVDDEIDNTSTNPVQNRIIAAALNAKQNTLTAGNNITIQNNVISASGSSVNPVSKTVEMTKPVGVDGNGKLWTAPSITEEIILTESTYYYESLYEAIQSINNNFDSYIVPQTNNVQVDIKVDGQILVTLLNNLSEVNQIHPLVDMTIDLNGYTIIVDQVNPFLIHNSDENINITINGRKEGSSIIKNNAGILFDWGNNVSNITDKSTLTTLSGKYLVTEKKNRQVSAYSLGNSNNKGIFSSLTDDPSNVKGLPFIVVTKGSYAGKSAEVGDIFVSDGSNYIHSPENSRYIKGTLGSDGDITQLPSPNSSNINHFYEVIEAGIYEGQTAEIGDFFFCGGNQNYEHWVHVKNLSYIVLENYNLPSSALADTIYEAILEGTYYEGNNSWENVKLGDMFYRVNNTWYYFKEKEIKYSLKTGGRSGSVYWGTSGKIIIKNCQINSEMEYPDSGGIQVTGIIGYGNCSFYLDSNNITACYTGRGISSRSEGISGSVIGIWNYLSKNFYIKNCSVTGNGPYDDLFGIDGLRNDSKIIIENCHIKGLHAGMGNSNSGKLYINGGVYESIGHGGIYAGGSSIAWIKNATIKEGNWVGRSVNTTSFNSAAFYMGGSTQDYSDAIIYLDNCIIEDNSPGNNSIVMRNLIQDAKLCFSNTELQQGAKIRIDQFSEPLNLIYNGEGSNITKNDLYVREEPLSFFPVGTNNGGIIDNLPSNDYIVSYTHLPLLIVTAGTYNNQSAQVGDIFVSNGSNWIYSSKDNRILKGTLGDNGDITQLPSPDSSNNNHFYEVVTAGAGPDSNARIGDYYFSNGNSWILVYVNSILSGTVDISQGIDLPDPSEYNSGEKFRVLSSGRYHTYTSGSSSSTILAYAGQVFMNKNRTEWIRLYPEQITYKLLIESPNKLNSHIVNTLDNYNYLNFSDCINDLSNSFEEILDENLSVFWCFYNQTSFTEIAEAFVKNNLCICNYNSKFYKLESIDAETKTAVFSCVNKNKIFILTCVNSTWSSSIGSMNAPIVSSSSNYTLSGTDIGCLIKATGNSEITIPLNCGVLNDELEIMNYGNGTITIKADLNVTLNGETSSTEDNGVFLENIYITKTIPNQYTSAVLKCVDTNEWVIQGAIS